MDAGNSSLSQLGLWVPHWVIKPRASLNFKLSRSPTTPFLSPHSWGIFQTPAGFKSIAENPIDSKFFNIFQAFVKLGLQVVRAGRDLEDDPYPTPRCARTHMK